MKMNRLVILIVTLGLLGNTTAQGIIASFDLNTAERELGNVHQNLVELKEIFEILKDNKDPLTQELALRGFEVLAEINQRVSNIQETYSNLKSASELVPRMSFENFSKKNFDIP